MPRLLHKLHLVLQRVAAIRLVLMVVILNSIEASGPISNGIGYLDCTVKQYI